MKSNNLRDIFIVTKFTFREIVQRKSFRISVIIISILLVLGFNLPGFISSLGDDAFSDTILVADPDNVFAGQLPALEQAGASDGAGASSSSSVSAGSNSSTGSNSSPGASSNSSTNSGSNSSSSTKYKVTADDLSTIKSQIEAGEASAAIVVHKEANGAKIQYIVDNMATMETAPQDLLERLQALYVNVQISKLNLTSTQLASLVPNFEFSVEQADDQEVGGNVFVAMMMSAILFFAIYICSYQVSSSIAVEKTSKIMETLVTSTSPRSIVIGKTIGIGLAGLLQIVIYMIVAVISAHAFLDPEMLSALLDFSNLSFYLVAILIVYFILGYLMYALLYALSGSTISKPEEIQSANTPVVIITLVGFYLAYFTLTDPTSSLNSLAALLPISSPFCMPLRIMMGVASVSEVILSIIILIITCIVVAHVAIKIYSNAILRYGTKLSWKDIIKSYKEK